MSTCICSIALMDALGIPDLVHLVHSYMPNKSDKDILLDALNKSSNCIKVSSSDDPLSEHHRRVSFRLTIGWKMPSLEIVLYRASNFSGFGRCGTLRILDDDCKYCPDFVSSEDMLLSVADTDDEFAAMYVDACEKVHRQILDVLNNCGCRHH